MFNKTFVYMHLYPVSYQRYTRLNFFDIKSKIVSNSFLKHFVINDVNHSNEKLFKILVKIYYR